MTQHPARPFLCQAVLVDLDGTLVDTRRGILAALTAALDEATGHAGAAGRADLSLPLDAMIQSADPTASDAVRRSVAAAFRRQYDLNFWDSGVLYPGAEDFLEMSRSAGIRAFVVTNKRTVAARRLLEHVGLARHLDGVVGQADAGEPIAKAQLLRRCISDAGLDPAATVAVGDSDQDAAAAMTVGLTFVAVTSGAGPLGHATAGEKRVEVGSLADAAALILGRLRGDHREP